MDVEEGIDKIIKMLTALKEQVDEMNETLNKLVSANSLGSAKSSDEVKVRAPSDIVMEQKLEKSENVESGRVQCPKCGSVKIDEREDKTKAISYSGGIAIYAKKYYCKECGYSWY
ncbi:MAG: hypothetical protein ACTSU2_03615 [Promethearchaeota archaeon]